MLQPSYHSRLHHRRLLLCCRHTTLHESTALRCTAQVGAEAAVGMIEGVATGTNWRLVAKTVCAWATTLVVAGGLSAAFFAFGEHTACISQHSMHLIAQDDHHTQVH